jgi:RES domain-containing protein
MRGWRICRAPYADLSGLGAEQFGGRWNSPGRPMVYAAEHPALAVVEVRVHLDLAPELLPDDYRLLAIDFADIEVETLAALPDSPQEFGDGWIAEKRTPLLRVPSLIVLESFNLLLNPAHPRATAARIETLRPFRFDPRLWFGVS